MSTCCRISTRLLPTDYSLKNFAGTMEYRTATWSRQKIDAQGLELRAVAAITSVHDKAFQTADIQTKAREAAIMV